MKWQHFAIFAGILVVLFASLVVACLLMHKNGPEEPLWQGIKLSDWMYGHVNTNVGSRQFFDAAGEAAIRAIGTNGLPTLVRMLGAKDSDAGMLIGLGTGGHPAIEERAFASAAIRVLGSNAFPAIPEIVKLTSNKDAEIRFENLVCLYLMHPDKNVLLPVLTERLKDSDQRIQEMAAGALARRYPVDAEQLGVFRSFPNLKTNGTNDVATNTPAAK